jgi:urea transporter
MNELDPLRHAFLLVAFVVIAETCMSGFILVGCIFGVYSAAVPTGSCSNIREDTFALMSGLLAAAIALMVGKSKGPPNA